MHRIMGRKDVKYNMSDKVPGSNGRIINLALFFLPFNELNY